VPISVFRQINFCNSYICLAFISISNKNKKIIEFVMVAGANMCTENGGKILKIVNKPLKQICHNSGYQFKSATISILLQICKITVNHKMLVYILY
jgi:hypothetical protein